MVFKAVKLIFSENYQHILPATGEEFPAGSKIMGFWKKKYLEISPDLPRHPKFNRLVPYMCPPID